MLSTLTVALSLVQQQISAEQIYEAAAPSVVTLTVERPHGSTGIGTAFLALKNGLAITAWHVVKGASSIRAKFSDGTEADVKGIVDKDVDLDIAIIGLDGGDRRPLDFADADPKVGSKAYVIGSPKGMDFSISDGIISQTPFLGNVRLFQFTCPVSAGNSGGPLLNSSGKVSGVVSWQLRDAQNLNFAIPVSVVTRLDAQKQPAALAAELEPLDESNPILTTVDDETLQSLIKRADLSATPQNDGTGINAFIIDSEGSKVTLFQYAKDEKSGPTENIALSAGFTTPTSVSLESLNKFNREHRFARAYRDDDGTVYLENDLDLSQGVGGGAITGFISDFSSTLHEFESEVLTKPRLLSKQSTPLKVKQGTDLLVRTVEDKQLESILKSEGLSATAQDDGTGKTEFAFRAGQVETDLYQFALDEKHDATASLTLAAGFQLERPVAPSAINAFNRRTRYFKAFLDADGDLYIVSDIDLQGGVTELTIKAFVHRFVSNIGSLKRELLRSGE